ncbi:hypothetical protein D9619_008388 [Psilocybe cf. subviscida]|uniref:Uncharacterized protein n=1 Tax=Psilocybe cf. subviscida TaxID=2480587 RepID=A0A8H5B9H0_9AGAR|nr:hypothetical protein D9619_008388 [Psilocybe cf. subviscida]
MASHHEQNCIPDLAVSGRHIQFVFTTQSCGDEHNATHDTQNLARQVARDDDFATYLHLDGSRQYCIGNSELIDMLDHGVPHTVLSEMKREHSDFSQSEQVIGGGTQRRREQGDNTGQEQIGTMRETHEESGYEQEQTWARACVIYLPKGDTIIVNDDCATTVEDDNKDEYFRVEDNIEGLADQPAGIYE